MPVQSHTPNISLSHSQQSNTAHSLSLAGGAGDLDLLHLDRGDRVVVVRGHLADLHEQIVALGDLGEDRVLAGRRRVPPVEVEVVGDVEEDLRAAAVRLAGVGLRTQHHVSKEGEGWVRLLPLAELVPG